MENKWEREGIYIEMGTPPEGAGSRRNRCKGNITSDLAEIRARKDS